MSDKLENAIKVINAYFESNTEDYWKTLGEISLNTRIEPNIVAKVITESGDFVRSSYRKKAGEPLFTSRSMFRNNAPMMDKIIGVFKNRID